jgi:NhaP-type Na+/H+ or K+/H+ antiporter
MSVRNSNVFWGVVLVVLGVLFLLANTGVLEQINWDIVWPVVLIAIGVWLVARRVGRVPPPSNPPPPSSQE